MNFREMDIKHSYISKGDDNIADSFLNPLLSCTKEYRRSVGFFSSGVFNAIMPGIMHLARNRGSIKLIASPKLTKDDAMAISLGYEQREKYILDFFTKDFEREIEELDDEKLCMLCDLIRKNILDINPEEIIYISCEPITLARDLKLLKEKYTVEKVIPVDNFPNTFHIESVTLLKRGDSVE